jgi:hypothetical protein
MLSKLRPRSVYDVAAALSLFIALGGTAYAVAANSVGTAQLKNGAVTNPKLAANSVGNGKVIDGSLAPEDLGGSLRTLVRGRCPLGSRDAPMDALGTGGWLCFDHFARGPAVENDALTGCADSGLRLASFTDLLLAASAGRLNPGTRYWTDWVWRDPSADGTVQWGRLVYAQPPVTHWTYDREALRGDEAHSHYYACVTSPMHS